MALNLLVLPSVSQLDPAGVHFLLWSWNNVRFAHDLLEHKLLFNPIEL